jgi:hypothetical protein
MVAFIAVSFVLADGKRRTACRTSGLRGACAVRVLDVPVVRGETPSQAQPPRPDGRGIEALLEACLSSEA